MEEKLGMALLRFHPFPSFIFILNIFLNLFHGGEKRNLLSTQKITVAMGKLI